MTELLDIDLTLATPAQGRTTPIMPRGVGSGRYRPHLRAGDSELLGVEFVGGPEILQPGERASCVVRLMYLDTGVDYSALRPGAAFQLVEGPHLVGTGTVLRRYQDS